MLAAWPNSGWTAVEASKYELIVQTYSVSESRSAAIVGSAVEMMDVSRAERKAVIHKAQKMTTNRHPFLGG
jgi:dihydrodipicolinate synthase/N-acetylneuraminate lyase